MHGGTGNHPDRLITDHPQPCCSLMRINPKEFPKSHAFNFLRDVEQQWHQQFGERGKTAKAFEMDEVLHL